MKKRLFFLLLFSFLFIIPTTARAKIVQPQNSTKIKEIKQLDNALSAFEKNGEVSLESNVFQVFLINMATTVEVMVGRKNPDGTTSEGALQTGGRLIGALYNNPPASADLYVADLMHSFNIAQPAYAQGLGFSSLSPILTGWKIFRNIAYVFFVLIVFRND